MDNQKIWDRNWEQLGAYSTQSAGSRWAFYLIRKVCENISLSRNAVIADVGCGVGAKSLLLANMFPNNDVYGVDYSSKGIDFATEYYKNNNLFFKCMDAHDLKNVFSDRLELIGAFELIEHIEDWRMFLADLCDTSNKYIVLSTPTGRMREYEQQLGHYRNYKKGEIEAFMAEHGYRTVSVLYAGFPFWSPITRDVYNFVNTRKKHLESDKGMEVSLNPILHEITYFFYRYFTFNRIGDQFVGLFERKNG